jgi:protein O-mannosyl-transferase
MEEESLSPMNSTVIPEDKKASAESGIAKDRQLTLVLALALAAVVIALYLPALRNGFVNYDDPDYITHNAPVLHGLNWQNVKWAFGTDNPAANWHPLTWISHMLDVQMFGLNPWGHHLVNILLMAADVALLFFFLAKATNKIWPSAAVAAIFAVHPLNVESVAWVAERKQELSLFFFFFTLLAYRWYLKKPDWLRYLAVALLFTLGLMSKVMIVTLPFVLLLLDYWPLQRFSGLSSTISLVKEKIPFFVLSVLAAAMTVLIHRKEGALTAAMPLAWRVKNAIYSYAVYLWKAVWPTRLAVFYPHPENRLPLWQIGISALALLGISALVWKYRERRYLGFGWLWYLGTAFPMIGVIQSGRQGMADRYEAWPIIGIFIAVVWLLADVFTDRRLRPALVVPAFAAVLLPLILLTHRQIGYWKDSETLFTHALQVTSRNGVAEQNLGVALFEKGDAAAAFPHFLAAVQYQPDLDRAHYNLGVLLQHQGRIQEAAEQYKFAIASAEDAEEASQAHNNLGVIFLTSNNLPAAKSEFDKAIQLNPAEMNSYLGRGTVEYQLGQIDNAIADFQQICSRGGSPVSYYWLGRAQEAKGQFTQAKSAYQTALLMNAGMEDARNRLKYLQALTGQ